MLCNAVCVEDVRVAGCHAGSAGEVTRWSAAASRRVTQCYITLATCPLSGTMQPLYQWPGAICRVP